MTARFIQLRGGGFINMNHVARISADRSENGSVPLAALYDIEGNRIATALWQAVENVDSTIVPASAGQFATCVAVDNDATDPAEQTSVSRYPIVAWRIRVDDSSPDPILAQPPASNEFVLIELPGGVLLAQDDREYNNLDEALVALRKLG